MRRTIVILLILFISGSTAFGSEVIYGEYTYTYGDSESLVAAKQKCMSLALRDAVESYFSFIQSYTEIENYQLKQDLIRSVAYGYARNTKVIEERINGRTIQYKIMTEVEPRQIKELLKETKFTTPRETIISENKWIAIINVYQVGRIVNVVYQHNATIKPGHPSFPRHVHITYYDSSNRPLGGDKYLTNPYSGRVLGHYEKGQICSTIFRLPENAESYRVWVAED